MIETSLAKRVYGQHIKQRVKPFGEINTSIQELTEYTQFDDVCLLGQHVQMTHFGVCPMVCPLNVWPGQGFYVELFLIVAFPAE